MARLCTSVRDQTLADNRARLLEAAAINFASDGYAGANINHISQAAGFAKGTVYNYFSSKRELMAALIRSIAADHITAILANASSSSDPAERLEYMLRAGFAFVERHPTLARVIISLAYGSDRELKNQVYRAYEPLFRFIRDDIVHAGTARGEFQHSNSDLATALIMAIYLGSCSELDASGKIELDARAVSRFILDGLRRRTETRRRGRIKRCK